MVALNFRILSLALLCREGVAWSLRVNRGARFGTGVDPSRIEAKIK